MSANIYELREAFDAVVQMLGEKKIRVEHRGMEFGIHYGSAFEECALTIPELPDSATPALLQRMRGIVDLMGARLYYSTADAVHAARKEGIEELFHIVDDLRCEQMMSRRLPGTKAHFSAFRRSALEEVYAERLEQAKHLSGADPDTAFVLMAPVVAAALNGDAESQVFLGLDFLAAIGPTLSKIEHLLSCASTLSSADEALEVSRSIRDALNQPPPPAPSQPSSGDDGEESEEENERQAEGQPNEPTEAAEKESSAEDDRAPPEGEEAFEEDLHAQGAEEAEAEAGDGSQVGESEGAQEGGDSQDGDDADESRPEEASDEVGEEKKAGDDSSEGEPDEGEQVEGGDPAADSADGDGEPEFDAGEEGVEAAELGEGVTSPGRGDAPFESMARSMTESLQDSFLSTFGASDYLVYSRDLDRITVTPEWSGNRDVAFRRGVPTSVREFIDNSSEYVGVIKSRLERAMEARSFSMKVGGQRSGRLSSNALSRLFMDDVRVFHRIEEAPQVNTALTLLIDSSGSMDSDNKIRTACESAYALASAMSRINVKIEILTFTTGTASHEFAAAAINFGRRVGGEVARAHSTLRIGILKSFEERFSNRHASRLLHQCAEGYMAANIDGECVEFAGWRLLKQPVERRILVVLSDGRPAGDREERVYSSHLRRVIQDLEKKKVTVIGIGINSSDVKQFYPRHVVVRKVADLGGAVLDQIRALLIPN